MLRRLVATTLTLALALALSALCGCRAENLRAGANAPATAAPAAQQVTPGDETEQPGLPDLAGLSVQRSGAAYSTTDRWHHGSQWDGLLPYERVTQSGLSGVFSPGPAAGPGGALKDCAWCIYSFSLPAYLDAPTLQLDWDSEPAMPPGGPQDAGTQPGYWIALANFETLRWDFFAQPAGGLLHIPLAAGALNLAPYHSSTAEVVLAAVIVTAPQGGTLRRIQLGGDGWVHTWAGEFYEDYRWDTFRDISLDQTGNVILSGHAEDLFQPNSGCSLLKYSAEGELLLQGVYTGGYYGCMHATAADGSIYLGCSKSYDGYSRLAKVHPNGWLEWQRAYQVEGFSECRLYDIQISPDGYIYQCMRMDGAGIGLSGGVVLKYDQDGTLIWARGIDASDTGSNDNGFSESLACGNDCVYVGGWPTVCKLDGDGNLLWQREIDEAGYDIRLFLESADKLQLACVSGDGVIACELDSAGNVGPGLNVGGLGQFPELNSLTASPDGLGLAIGSGFLTASLLDISTGAQPALNSAWRVSDNLYPGAILYDNEGALLLAGGFHVREPFVQSFAPLELQGEVITLEVSDPGKTVSEIAGGPVDYPGDFLWVYALEDDLRPGIVSDNPGIVLKHEF